MKEGQQVDGFIEQLMKTQIISEADLIVLCEKVPRLKRRKKSW